MDYRWQAMEIIAGPEDVAVLTPDEKAGILDVEEEVERSNCTSCFAD